MEVIYTEIDYLVTLPEHCGGAGDIAPAMALGSVEAARACADRVWGSPSLQGRSVALQGLGAVGANALALFIEHGTHVVVSDVDEKKVANAVATYGVSAVATDDIYD
jgi:leucine dehydrogenase